MRFTKIRHHKIEGGLPQLFLARLRNRLFVVSGALHGSLQEIDVAGHCPQDAQLGLDLFVWQAIPLRQKHGIPERHFGGEGASEQRNVKFLFHEADFLAGVKYALVKFRVNEPFAIAAVAPFAEVLFADGDTIEAGFEGLPGFGQAVEPFEEGGPSSLSSRRRLSSSRVSSDKPAIFPVLRITFLIKRLIVSLEVERFAWGGALPT